MTDPTPDRPLVTFALFAYNQEDYIRQAVEGAFAQTYEPLEIILSDDCSKDKTFEIMQEMVAAYKGPHQIKLRRNQVNQGLIEHVNLVLGLAAADFIVLAAGDDVSEPNRSAVIAQEFLQNPACQLLHSSVREMDEQGNLQGLGHPPAHMHKLDLEKFAKSQSIYIGATGAIRKNLFTFFGPITENETYEDLTLGFRAALLDGIKFVDEPLVRYRTDIGLMSQFKRSSESRRERRKSYLRLAIATYQQRKLDLSKVSHENQEQIGRVLLHEFETSKLRMRFHSNLFQFFASSFTVGIVPFWKALRSELRFSFRLID